MLLEPSDESKKCICKWMPKHIINWKLRPTQTRVFYYEKKHIKFNSIMFNLFQL